MNGARQALIEDMQHVHAGAWAALSTMAGFEAGADAQIEALMKAHALTGQVFVVCASNYVDETCIEWMAKNLGEQDLVKRGCGWSAIIHPFCVLLAGSHTGEEEKLVTADIDLEELAAAKVWVDAAGHYQRPEVLRFNFNRGTICDNDKIVVGGRQHREDVGADAVEKTVEHGEASTPTIQSQPIQLEIYGTPSSLLYTNLRTLSLSGLPLSSIQIFTLCNEEHPLRALRPFSTSRQYATTLKHSLNPRDRARCCKDRGRKSYSN